MTHLGGENSWKLHTMYVYIIIPLFYFIFSVNDLYCILNAFWTSKTGFGLFKLSLGWSLTIRSQFCLRQGRRKVGCVVTRGRRERISSRRVVVFFTGLYKVYPRFLDKFWIHMFWIIILLHYRVEVFLCYKVNLPLDKKFCHRNVLQIYMVSLSWLLVVWKLRSRTSPFFPPSFLLSTAFGRARCWGKTEAHPSRQIPNPPGKLHEDYIAQVQSPERAARGCTWVPPYFTRQAAPVSYGNRPMKPAFLCKTHRGFSKDRNPYKTGKKKMFHDS